MLMSSSDFFLLNCVKEDEIMTDTSPVDQFLSNSSFDLSHGESSLIEICSILMEMQLQFLRSVRIFNNNNNSLNSNSSR